VHEDLISSVNALVFLLGSSYFTICVRSSVVEYPYQGRSRSACGHAAGVGIVPEMDLICSYFQGISINNSSLNALLRTHFLCTSVMGCININSLNSSVIFTILVQVTILAGFLGLLTTYSDFTRCLFFDCRKGLQLPHM